MVSLLDLREITFDALSAAEDDLLKYPVEIIGSDEVDLIRLYWIQDDTLFFNVARFEFFADCDCDQYRHTRTACRHIAATFAPTCRTCRDKQVEAFGDHCSGCAIQNAPYIKPGSGRKPEKIGEFFI